MRSLYSNRIDIFSHFVKTHKTIGYLSEKEGESLHSICNKELQQLHGVRDQELKLSLLLKRFELFSKADQKLQIAKIRKCVECKGNVFTSFFRKGKCILCDETNM